MYKLFLIPVTCLLFACGSGANLESGSNVTNDDSTDELDTLEVIIQPAYKVKAVIGDYMESDPVDILSASIEGNTLNLVVSYSGNCTEHTFEFIGSPVVMKSLPPKRTVKLIHHAASDSCEARVNQKIEIDISDLAYLQETGNEIILLLSGYKGELHFIYE